MRWKFLGIIEREVRKLRKWKENVFYRVPGYDIEQMY